MCRWLAVASGARGVQARGVQAQREQRVLPLEDGNHQVLAGQGAQPLMELEEIMKVVQQEVQREVLDGQEMDG